MGFPWLLLLLTCTTKVITVTDCTGINGISPQCDSPEAFHKRDVFWVGGQYVEDAVQGLLTYDQMYVEKLTPLGGVNQTYPLVFFHGGGISGATWLNTPDNRKGMASLFLDRGYLVYIIDQTSVGRGTQNDLTNYPLQIGSSANITEAGFTDVQDAPASFQYPQSQLHTQWPGTGAVEDPVFDQFEASFIPLTTNATRQENSMRASGCTLLTLLGPSILISHSAGATYPLIISDACPALVAANVNIEPANNPFTSFVSADPLAIARPYGLSRTPITYSPPITDPSQLMTEINGADTPGNRSCTQQSTAPGAVIRALPNIAEVPYVAFTGQASQHATYDHCIIQYLQQAGVPAEWIKMEDVGVYGNAHFGFLELNNVAYFEVVEGWIANASLSR